MSLLKAYSEIKSSLAEAWEATLEYVDDVWAEKNARNLVQALQTIPGSLTVPLPNIPSVPTLSNEAEALRDYLSLAYQLAADRKATMPSDANYVNLAATIRTIPRAHGIITYRDVDGGTKTYAITSSVEMRALSAGKLSPETPWTLAFDSLTIASDQVLEFEWLPLAANDRVNYFLCGCSNLTTVSGTEYLNVMGRAFCGGCPKLNCPITYIAPQSLNATDGDDFLWGCATFNSPVTIKVGAKYIGSSFLFNCEKFNQPLILPSTLLGIEDEFLSDCHAFNQPLEIPAGLSSLGSGFLQNCRSFNQPLTLPDNISTIEASLLSGCTNFNSKLVLPLRCTQLNVGFLARCAKFNQPLTLPSGLETIGGSFMAGTSAFSQPLSIPDSVTSIRHSFMTSPVNFLGPLTVPAGISYYGDDAALSAYVNTNPSYIQGITISGPGAAELRAAYPNKSSGYYRKLK